MLVISRNQHLRSLLNQFSCVSSSISKSCFSSNPQQNPPSSVTPQNMPDADEGLVKGDKRTIKIRRQRAGTDKPIFSSPEEYLAKAQSWKAQLPHEDDPSSVMVSPEPRRSKDEPSNRFFSPEWLIKMGRRLDVSVEGVTERWQHEFWLQTNEKQKFNPTRHAILGPDLATAHFIAYRGGRIKFVGHSEWWADEKALPAVYEEGFIIEKIDATACGLVGEGITNMSNLYNLTDLNLSNNLLLDVFAFDKLYRQFRFSTCLRHLNLTGCLRFCENSLAAIHRLPSLEEVIITNTGAAEYKFLELIVIMLHDINPRLKVIV